MSRYLVFLSGGFLGMLLSTLLTDHFPFLLAGFLAGVLMASLTFAIGELLGDPTYTKDN